MLNRRLPLFMAGILFLAVSAFAQVGNIEGTVRLPMDGGPARGATVTLFHFNSDTLVAQSDSLGHFRFDSVPIGEWRLTAFLAPYQPVSAFVRIMSGQTAHPVLVFAPVPTGFGRVDGVVLLPFHAGPAAGARVVLFRGPGDSLVTLSDSAGHFFFDSARRGVP